MSLKIYPKEIWISQITDRIIREKPTGAYWAHYKLVKQTPLSPEQKKRTKRSAIRRTP